METVQQKNPDLTGGTALLIQRKVVKYRHKNTVSKEDLAKASMSDAFINFKAAKDAYKNHNDSLSAKAERGFLFLGIPAAVSIAQGALTPVQKTTGAVAEKVKNTLHAGKKIGVMIAGMLGAFSIINAATNKIPALKEFKRENPGLATAGALTGTIAAAVAANPAIDAISSKIGKIPAKGETIGSFVKAQANGLLNKLNGTKAEKVIENKIFEPTKKFLTETKAGRILNSKWGIGLFIGGVVTKFLIDGIMIRNDKKQIKQSLENERKESRQKLLINPFDNATEKNNFKRTEINNILIIPVENKEEE